MDMTFSMHRLTKDDVTKLHEYAKANHVNLARVVESQLLAWLKSMEEKFTDYAPCPKCALQGFESILKGLPILEAEHAGLIKIKDTTNIELLTNTLFVICPRCLWSGIPEKQE